MTLAGDLATKAETIVRTVKETVYQHTDHIVPESGIYDCDCNGFVGYILRTVAPDHFAKITPEPGQSRPRAFVYFDFFAGLPPDSGNGWDRIEKLADAQRGDIVAWRFPTVVEHVDTGHVVMLAETPSPSPSGDFTVIKVYDSAAEPHFDDTRLPNGVASPTGSTGVGSGSMRMKVDAEGRPIAYLFAPPDTAQFEYREIAIGRVKDPQA